MRSHAELLSAARLLREAATFPERARELGSLLESKVVESVRIVMKTDPRKIYKFLRKRFVPYVVVLALARGAGLPGLSVAEISTIVDVNPSTVRRRLRNLPLAFLALEITDSFDDRRKLYTIGEPLHGNLLPSEFRDALTIAVNTITEAGSWDLPIIENKAMHEIRESITAKWIEQCLMATDALLEDIMEIGQRFRKQLGARNLISLDLQIRKFLERVNQIRPFLSDQVSRRSIAQKIHKAVFDTTGQGPFPVGTPDTGAALARIYLAFLAYELANGEKNDQHAAPAHELER